MPKNIKSYFEGVLENITIILNNDFYKNKDKNGLEYVYAKRKKYNVVAIFNKDLSKTLMCKRAKEPYKGMYNLVGGKIESEDYLDEAYRELKEETNIKREDVSLIYFMNLEYITLDKSIEVYYVIFK